MLSLDGWVSTRAEGVLEVSVSGDQILIDAMHTACSLGPLDAHVESIMVQPCPGIAGCDGFTVRSD